MTKTFVGLCVVTVLSLGTVGRYSADRVGQRGDLNCDGSTDFGDINPFVLYLSDFACWQATYGCDPLNGDINGDGTYPSFGDINPFVALLVNGPPYIGDCWHGPCEQRHEGRAFCPEDEFALWVEGDALHAMHYQAEYNCCPEDIVVSLTVTGRLVRLDETEVPHEPPCPCLCCYEIGVTVVGLPPGTYTVEYCWIDCDLGPQCHVEEIVVP
jgi:hypothetical protein